MNKWLAIRSTAKDFIYSDREKYKLSFLNNFMFLVPPLLWNLAYGSNNPAQLGYFDGEAPGAILITENVFRAAAMTYPLLLPINSKLKPFKPGLATYGIGLLMYFSSWYYLMNFQGTALSMSLLMRFSPAYLPIIWFGGISLMSQSKIQFSLSVVFIGLHLSEYILKYN